MLAGGPRPILVDAGFGSVGATRRTEAFLAGHGLAPADLALVAATHFHPDHVGGVAWLQREHGVTVAAHEDEAALINQRDPRRYDAAWLAQPVTDFTVDRPLRDGDVLDTGSVALHVIATPGQTPGHLALWEPETRTVITGDLLQRDDVAWLPVAGPWSANALEQAIDSVERLAALGARRALPGHGPPVTDVPAVTAATLARYRAWRARPEAAARHGLPRGLVTALLLGPASEDRLARLPFLRDLAGVLGAEPLAVVGDVAAALVARGVVHRDPVTGMLRAALPREPAAPPRVA